MTREQIEAAILTAPTAKGRCAQMRRLHGIEDYLFIGGDAPAPETWRTGFYDGTPARVLAARLGRSERTIRRYRRKLREMTS